MEISENVYNEICDGAGEQRVEKAQEFIKNAKVDIINLSYEDDENFYVSGLVEGNNGNYETEINIVDDEINSLYCECIDFENRNASCKHIIATIMKLMQNKYWDKNYTGEELKNIGIEETTTDIPLKMTNYRRIVQNLYNYEIEELNSENNTILEDKVQIIPRLSIGNGYYDNSIRLDFKIGNKKLYKIKDLKEFYFNVENQLYYKYGINLAFEHSKDNFAPESLELLEFILKYAEVMTYTQENSKYAYYESNSKLPEIRLNRSFLDQGFDVLKNCKKILDQNDREFDIKFIEGDPDIKFELIKNDDNTYKLTPNTGLIDFVVYYGKDYVYVYKNQALYRCTEKFQNTVLRLANIFRNSYVWELDLEERDLNSLYSVIMPKVGNCIELKNIDEKDIEKYKPKELGTKVYLDFDENNNIVADVKFCYDNEEFNPLDKKINISISRNVYEENNTLNTFRKTGFMVDKENKKFILANEEMIYNFLENDIVDYMKKFEVLATENFKTKEIKKPKIVSIGVKVENNLLSVDLSKINIDKKELENIMQKYKLKKKYHRLKDGNFIDLQGNDDIEFLDKLITGMDLEYKDLEKDSIKLPVNRTLYLDGLLKKQNIKNVSKNGEFSKIVNDLEYGNPDEDFNLPKNMENILRDYQKTGFKWLKVLDSYHFGGILADDMGLGKTLQLISVISDYIEKNKKNRKTSLVVSPSSLTLNWKNEFKKFAPKLNIEVINGNVTERKQKIRKLDNYDVIITSYDLLKRDLTTYKMLNYNFKFIVADEAQYMKNSNTLNAKAIKSLNSETRFALTGTPIENSLSELWSIFDFVMPGYLFSYKKFKQIYEMPIVKDQDEQAMSKLKILIEPFILRRNKKDVLTELPEKTITVINNKMEDEQELVYLSYLARIKQEVAEEININGFEKSQIKILAGLTRLRQICCHPGLFIENYKGGSSKLNQCMELIDDAISASHKILLFSGYTSMFNIIEKRLEEKNIKYFKLTGNTKVDERIKLVDEFNTNPEIKVFLISLKAGGTGLNLTGADMVIHYDPWWNQSAENQATDRAYRIGQKNNVQVYKLITSDSIEEKIYELQQKKATLIDNMLDTKTSFINKFTKEEIMNLFE